MRNDTQDVLPEGLAAEAEASGGLRLRLHGDLDAARVASLWGPAFERVLQAKPASLRLDLSSAGYIDGSGMALLVNLRAAAESAGAVVEIVGLADRYKHLLGLAERSIAREAAEAKPDRRGPARRVSEGMDMLGRDLRALVSFVGESALALWDAARHPEQVRWKDVVTQALAVGVESLPILLLIGFLMGLIMSFQSVITLTRFGGEIFVPNMLGLVMFREMGPLVTAILLAARSGSAFAAEIGTMHVNEELDALSTMGISPVRFLVVPRILASLAVTPVMTLIFNFASLVGGALVMLSIGFPLVVFTSRVFANVTATDLIGSFIKIVWFSLLVCGVSCLKGLRTGGGASAVGRSTTGAVVAGLILITVADGLFAVLFYYYKF
jgi:phospholipid/cholesterol/gamma-HCH transport system permease protein